MKNITVTVDDDTYRRARVRAAEQDTSVSALVKEFLLEIAAGDSGASDLKRQERTLRDEVGAFRASDRVSRDEANARRP